MTAEEVTKSKSEGRVAAGKRLVEWNRKNKENLLKNKDQVATSVDSSAPSGAAGDQQEPVSQTTGDHAVFYGSGALAIFVVGVVALYLYRGKTSDSKPSKAASTEEHDIFCMN